MVFVWISDIGFEVPDAFLVGYALDYNEYFRDLSVSVTLLLQKLHVTEWHTCTIFVISGIVRMFADSQNVLITSILIF